MSKPTMSEAEAKKKLEEATAALEKQITKGKAQFGIRIGQLQERLAALDAELADLDVRRAQLAPYQDHPEGAFHYQRIELLHRGNAHMRQALAIELACVEHNAQVLEVGPGATSVEKGENPFREPENDPAFLEARATSDMYLAGFHWVGLSPAIDAIMRVGVKEAALRVMDADQEQACLDRANRLKAAMQGDPELTMKVTRWAGELQEAALLLDWAKSALKRLANVPVAERKATFEDPDWAKLNGKALFLGSLAKQAQEAHPALAALFAPPAPAEQAEAAEPELA
ncbi:MAG: hypothetical protein ACK46X_12920 [Candidatus Sericytochromatia bacterium]